MKTLSILLVLLVLPVFAQQPQTDPGDIYAPSRFLRIDITMSADDWFYVRTSHRKGDDTLAQLVDKAYEYRKGDVTIDGVRTASVGIRKKGFFGSAVSTRPSLKIHFDTYVDGQTFAGTDELTLNNNNQDKSLVETSLAYQFFRKAGVPAPRTSFAHVFVNGEDLGVYTNVEDIGKPLLQRLFGNSNGVLYEGYVGDFTRNLSAGIVEKRGSRNQKRDRITRLSEMIEAPGPVSLERIGQLVDLEAFLRFWAAEVLLGHWDGYAGNKNNYFLYQDTKTEKLHFLPWGTDAVFDDPGPFIRVPVPKSVKAVGLLCRRLWEVPGIRERYRAEMKRQLAGPWSEAEMTGAIAGLQQELDTRVTTNKAAKKAETDRILAFIRSRRADIQRELDAPAPVWPEVPEDVAGSPTATTMIITGTFEAPFLQAPSANPFASGTAAINIDVGGTTQPAFARTAASVVINPGLGPDGVREGYPTLNMLAMDGAQVPSVWVLSIPLDPHLLKTKAANLPVDHFEAWARILQGKPDPGAANANRRLFGVTGEMKFLEVSLTPGGRLSGSFTFKTPAF